MTKKISDFCNVTVGHLFVEPVQIQMIWENRSIASKGAFSSIFIFYFSYGLLFPKKSLQKAGGLGKAASIFSNEDQSSEDEVILQAIAFAIVLKAHLFL